METVPWSFEDSRAVFFFPTGFKSNLKVSLISCPNLAKFGLLILTCFLAGISVSNLYGLIGLFFFLVTRFFVAPEGDIQKRQQGELLTRVLEEAHTVHLWNSITSNKVPELNSLVGTILSRSCLRCKDSL